MECVAIQEEGTKGGKPGGKPRHVASVRKVHQTREEQNLDQEDSISDATDSSLFHLTGSTQVQTFEVTVMVDNKPLRMEIDTGATSSLVAETTFKELWPDKVLTASKVRLCSYSGEYIPVLGCTNVKVEYKGQMETLPLIVFAGTGPSRLGHEPSS